MKNKIFLITIVVLALLSTKSNAQFNPYSEGKGLASAGFRSFGLGNSSIFKI